MADSHAAASRSGARYARPLTIAFVLVLFGLVVEVVAAVIAGSLALASDAGHMATDGIGLGMAVAAIAAAGRGRSGSRRTFGVYRLEILAALANAILLFAVAGYVVWESVQRLSDPPAIPGLALMVGAGLGLAVNVASWRLLRDGASENLNVEGAYLEVLADLLGSIAVVVAAIVISVSDWFVLDPIVGAAVALFILPRAWRLAGKALTILLQAAPEHVDVGALRRDLERLTDVVDIHDLHVWTLTSDMEVASVHLVVHDAADHHGVLDRATALLRDDYGIAHATLQVEPETHEGCAEISW